MSIKPITGFFMLAVMATGCAKPKYVPFAVNTSANVPAPPSLTQKAVPPLARTGAAPLSQHLREEAENLKTRAINAQRHDGLVIVEKNRQRVIDEQSDALSGANPTVE